MFKVSGVERRLYGLAARCTPPGHGFIQDLTHEREWRLFDDLLLSSGTPAFVIAPSLYTLHMKNIFGDDKLVIPIDILLEWGA